METADIGSLKIYGPLGLFCAALIVAVIVLWRALGKKDHVISGFVTSHMTNVKEHQTQIFAMVKDQRDEITALARQDREELVRLTKEHREDMEAMTDRVVEGGREQAKELRAILDRELTMAESLGRKLDIQDARR